jgi:hypothetical protein
MPDARPWFLDWTLQAYPADDDLEKYRALGREAPPVMLALADATKQVQQTTHATVGEFLDGIPIVGQFLAALSVERIGAFVAGAIESTARLEDLADPLTLALARELRARHGLLVFGTSWYQLPLGDAVMGLFSAEEHRFGAHAGAMETAMMLALSPQDVRMAQAQNFASAAQKKAARFSILGDGRSAKQGWHMQDYNPDGAAGNALAAQADHGQALVQAAGLQLARMLREVVEHPPL